MMSVLPSPAPTALLFMSFLVAPSVYAMSILNDDVVGELFFTNSPNPTTNYFLPGNGVVPVGACQGPGAISTVNDPNPACGNEFVVDDGVGRLDVDITGTGITLLGVFNQNVPSAFSQRIVISDIDVVGGGSIVDVVELADNLPNGGFAFTFTDDSVTFEWAGGNVGPATLVADYQLVFSSVPVPSTLFLMCGALSGFFYRIRKDWSC